MSPFAIGSAAVAEDVSASVGNEACAACHASIYQSYGRTAMARASGPARENVIPADFVHPIQGCTTASTQRPNHVWLSFDRPGDPAVRGKRELLYYIGSGRRGLSYLFAQNGFLFESPVNWYGNAQRWDMAPAYQNAREIPLNLPALPVACVAMSAECELRSGARRTFIRRQFSRMRESVANAAMAREQRTWQEERGRL